MSLVDDLRGLADFLEGHPHLMEKDFGTTTFNIFFFSMEDLTKAARPLGSADKFGTDKFAGFRKSFGRLNLDLFVSKEDSCERVVVGVKQVPVMVIPAHGEEIIEWRCPQSFLARKGVSS